MCGLSERYVARVAQIRAQHIPEGYFKKDQVVLQKMKPRGGRDGEKVLLCRTLQPAFTTKALVAFHTSTITGKTTRYETSAALMRENYHFMTMKVRKSDGAFVMWIPGLDRNTGLCVNLETAFVRIGLR